MWWALIEEITPRAKEMTGEKQMVWCVRGYHIYKSIWAAAIGELLVCRCWCVVIGKFSLLKNYIHIKYFHTLSVFEKIFYNEKRRKKVNYNICSPLHVTINGSIRPLSCTCSHLVMCLLRLLLQTGLQLLHGNLTGLLTILGAVKKPPWGVTKIHMNKLRQFPEVSSIIHHSFGIGHLFLYCSHLTSVSTISLSV